MAPLVSILIPTYNCQQWVAETLKSAIDQTWARKEIIVVDDGSSDNTVAIARQFESRSVKVVVKENGGAAAARNHAYSLCQGDFIQWLDADDLLSPTKVEDQVEILDGDPYTRWLASGPWGSFRYRQHMTRFTPTSLWKNLSPADWLVHKMGENVFMQTATWLTSRRLSEAAGPWNTNMLSDDDGEYFCRVLLASEGTRFVNESKVYYRVTGGSRLSSIGKSDRKKEALLGSMRLHIGYLRSLEESERVYEACMNYIHTSLIYFYPERKDLVAEFEALAKDMGKQLVLPRLRWKYAWMARFVGWETAKEAQFILPSFKSSMMRYWDQVMYHLESKTSRTGAAQSH